MKLQWLVLLLLTLSGSTWAQTSVVDTVHNLSTSGPGEYKSQTVDQVCVFCHTPHRAARGPGLWNREIPQTGTPGAAGQDTGLSTPLGWPSVLCMSCHDGTIALGSMLSPPNRGAGVDMRDVFLRGRSAFGPDLSNHHPVSVPYTAGTGASSRQLIDAGSVALPLRDGEIHCTTCHEPHSSKHPPFLRESGLDGELCQDCHVLSGSGWNWGDSAHATSGAVPRAGDPWSERKAEWKGRTVAENACENCHAPHNAGSPNALGVDVEERTCFRCHNGSVAEFNIQSEIQNFYRHPVDLPSGQNHSADEIRTAFSLELHVECEDCHNPHASRSDVPMISFAPANPFDSNHGTAPFLTGAMIGVSGLDIHGNPKIEADYEYEVCFKCHGIPGRSACDNLRCPTALNSQMERQDNQYNLREKFDPSSPSLKSYHPLYQNNPDNDAEVPSLRIDIPLNRFDSLIYCNDCHSGDKSISAGGSGPSGPHGSRHEAILALGYELDPDRRFNLVSSPLCFNCHDSGNLFSDESFLHRQHVLDQGDSCVNCHDPHGSAAFPHLINFLTTASTGGRVLRITGAGSYSEPTWIDTGRYQGTCWLNCHGVLHEGNTYGTMETGEMPLPETPN